MLKFQSVNLDERFKKSRSYGYGTCAISHRVWCNKTCRLFLLKTFSTKMDEESNREVQQEIKRNFSLRHNNIITYYEAFEGENDETAFTA